MSQQVGLLQWVVVENELRQVSEFAHLPPKLRPSAFCPVCERSIVMKLGKQKIHHAAHAPESLCVLTNPETAVHFNTKMHIARQLQQAPKRELYILQKCPSCYRSKVTTLWVQDWDDVKVEQRLENNLQPDIHLLKQGNVVAAIEIFVTHSVHDEKAAKLQAIDLSWVEVEGKTELFIGDNVWHVGAPLPVFKTNYSLEEERLCEDCFAQRAESKEREEWLKIDGDKSLEYKVIDFFYPHGQWMRNLFDIVCTLENGKETQFTLARRKTSLNIDRIKYYEEEEHVVARIFPPVDRREAIEILKNKGREFLKNIKNKNGIIFDSPMPWIAGSSLSLDSFDLRNFPRRYYFNKNTRQWFMPNDRKLMVWFDNDGTCKREITYWHRP